MQISIDFPLILQYTIIITTDCYYRSIDFQKKLHQNFQLNYSENNDTERTNYVYNDASVQRSWYDLSSLEILLQ